MIKTTRRKLMAVLLALLILAALLPTGAFAAGGIAFEAGSVSAALTPGATVRVPIVATANSGYGSGILTVSWKKSVLRLTDVEYSALAPKGYSAPIANTGKYIIDFGDDLAQKNFTGTGTFFTLVFEVTSTAAKGEYTISLSDFDINDKDIVPVTATGKAGKVTLGVASVTGSLSGGKLSYTAASAPEGAKLIAARYDGGHMTAAKIISGSITTGKLTLGGKGSTYRLFLLDSSGGPLCEAWCNE